MDDIFTLLCSNCGWAVSHRLHGIDAGTLRHNLFRLKQLCARARIPVCQGRCNRPAVIYTVHKPRSCVVLPSNLGCIPPAASYIMHVHLRD
jgi:hypothetical protein